MTKKFTKEHEWVAVEGKQATIGITAYAQEQLGDIVFVELPQIGQTLAQGGDAGVVESVKAASEIYAPISGTVTEVNSALDAEPALANSDPMGGGWFFKMELAAPDELDGLLDAAAYEAYVKGLS